MAETGIILLDKKAGGKRKKGEPDHDLRHDLHFLSESIYRTASTDPTSSSQIPHSTRDRASMPPRRAGDRPSSYQPLVLK